MSVITTSKTLQREDVKLCGLSSVLVLVWQIQKGCVKQKIAGKPASQKYQQHLPIQVQRSQKLLCHTDAKNATAKV